MPDLKTELTEKVVPNLGSLNFDDEFRTPPTTAAPPTAPDALPNIQKEVWAFVRDNPGCGARDFKHAPGLAGRTDISTRLTQLKKRKKLRVQGSYRQWEYYVTSDTYEGKPQRKHAGPKAVKATEAEKPVKPVKPATPEPWTLPPPSTPVRGTALEVLSTLPVAEAYALHKELQKMFRD